jgi:hypothetical protein
MDHYPGMENRFSFSFQVMNDLRLGDVEDFHAQFLRPKAEIDILVEIEKTIIKVPQSIKNTLPDNETGSIHPINFPKLGMVPFFHGIIFHKPAVGEITSQKGALNKNVER